MESCMTFGETFNHLVNYLSFANSFFVTEEICALLFIYLYIYTGIFICLRD